jgi:hypothetical protein
MIKEWLLPKSPMPMMEGMGCVHMCMWNAVRTEKKQTVGTRIQVEVPRPSRFLVYSVKESRKSQFISNLPVPMKGYLPPKK